MVQTPWDKRMGPELRGPVHFRGPVYWGSSFQGVLFIEVSSFQGVLFIEVSSFQGCRLERFNCIYSNSMALFGRLISEGKKKRGLAGLSQKRRDYDWMRDVVRRPENIYSGTSDSNLQVVLGCVNPPPCGVQWKQHIQCWLTDWLTRAQNVHKSITSLTIQLLSLPQHTRGQYEKSHRASN